MKKFTKLLCLVLALLMLVSTFAACGGDSGTTNPGSQNTPTTDKPATDKPSSGTEDGPADRNSVKDTVPTTLDFGGEKMVFFVRNDNEMWKNEMDVEATTTDTLFDAIYYRNASVEKRLDVTISTIGQSGTFNASNEWNSTLRNAVLTNSSDFEAAAIYASTGSALAVEGLYYNVLNLPHINLDKPWWNQTIRNELTLFDNLYYLGGDIAITETTNGMALFYNKNLFGEIYPDNDMDLYKTVNDGAWTIDVLHELIAGAWIDDNNNGVLDDGDTAGLKAADDTSGDGGMDAWIPAMGIKLTTIVDDYPMLTFYDEHTVAAFNKLKNLHKANPGAIVGTGDGTQFTLGNLLFSRGNLNSGSNFRIMEDKYGLLPLPKYDAEQDDYYTTFDNTSSLIVVLSNCKKLEKVGATLELMAAESYKQVIPAYFETCLKGKYSENPYDAQMYDRILSSFVFNFGFCYSTKSLDGVGSLFRDLNGDIAQKYQASKVKYEKALDDLIDKLDELAWKTSMGE